MGAEQSTPTEPLPSQDSQAGDSRRPPSALVICGPSGVGKGTLIERLSKEADKFGFSVSHTTRAPREGEQDGVHYHYVTKEQFEAGIAEGKFLEHAHVHGNIYGTSWAAVQAVADSGKVCVLDIDVQGARSVRKAGAQAIFVFIAPPSLEELERRLVGRGTESKEQVERRLAAARGEIQALNEKGLFDYLLVNDDLEMAYKQLRNIAERALQGLPAEPGKVPEKVLLEDDTAEQQQQQQAATAATASSTSPSTATVGTSTTPKAGGSGASGSSVPAGMEKWAGKVALVTGASSGIGWAVCEKLATSGMKVVAVARRRERLEKLQQHVLKLGVHPSAFLPVVCDITKDAEVAALPKIVAKRWPDCGIDVLVNNAGLSRNDASLFSGNTASWVEMISTNVLGTCMCIREAVQDMRRRNSYGHIINMVGLSGHRIPDGPQGGGFYCATKYAVRAITEGLRQEARGAKVPLRVSGISPGIVETEFFSVRAFGDPEAAKRATSQFKCLEPANIADAIVWCLSAPSHMEVDDVVIRPTEQLI